MIRGNEVKLILFVSRLLVPNSVGIFAIRKAAAITSLGGLRACSTIFALFTQSVQFLNSTANTAFPARRVP